MEETEDWRVYIRKVMELQDSLSFFEYCGDWYERGKEPQVPLSVDEAYEILKTNKQ